MLRLATTLLIGSLLACTQVPANVSEPGSSTSGASEREPGSSKAGAQQPLPHDYEFAFVTFGGRGERAFHEMVDKGGPAMVAAIWVGEEWPEALAPIIDREFAAVRDRYEQSGEYEQASVTLERQQLVELGQEPPGSPIWLIGPAGPCQAEVGAPVLSWYAWGLHVIELSWRLIMRDARSECALENPGQWSQIAVIADSLPSDLRYVAATTVSASRIDLANWSSPYAPLVAAALQRHADMKPDEVWVREVAVPGTDLVELTIALVRRDRGGPGQPPEPCMDEQRNVVEVGLMRDGIFSRFDLVASDGRVEDATLRGAFVQGSEVVWSVHEAWGQAYVHAPLRSPSVAMLEVASFHPEDFGELEFSQIEYCGP